MLDDNEMQELMDNAVKKALIDRARNNLNQANRKLVSTETTKDNLCTIRLYIDDAISCIDKLYQLIK